MLRIMYTYFLRAGVKIKIPKSLTNEDQQWLTRIFNGAYRQFHFEWNLKPHNREKACKLFRDVVLRTMPESFK